MSSGRFNENEKANGYLVLVLRYEHPCPSCTCPVGSCMEDQSFRSQLNDCVFCVRITTSIFCGTWQVKAATNVEFGITRIEREGSNGGLGIHCRIIFIVCRTIEVEDNLASSIRRRTALT